MPKVTLRVYEELNEYLPQERRKKDFEVCLENRCTVAKVLKGRGIPEEEVDLVLVNGWSVPFDQVLRDGDRVSVYPVFERFDVCEVTRLPGRPLRILQFVAEESLGETADRMKDLGFDVMCTDLQEAMEISRTQKRILLTTKSDVAKSGGLTHLLHVAPGRVEDQIREILRHLQLL
jgi:sulfur carrier protein ThiS